MGGYTTYARPNTYKEDFIIGDNYSITFTSYSNSSIVPGHVRIKTPTEYGFPWATTMVAQVIYLVDVAAAATTGNFQVLENTNGDATFGIISGTEVTTTELVPTKKVGPSTFNVSANDLYYVQGKSSSPLNAAQIYGAHLLITFS